MLGNLVITPDDKANLFNNFFAFIFLSSDWINTPAGTPSDPRGGAPRPRVSEDLVRELLEGLDMFKSAGPDDLHPQIAEGIGRGNCGSPGTDL